MGAPTMRYDAAGLWIGNVLKPPPPVALLFKSCPVIFRTVSVRFLDGYVLTLEHFGAFPEQVPLISGRFSTQWAPVDVTSILIENACLL